MMNKMLVLLPILVCFGCSSKIDEHHAQELVEHELSLSGDVSAHRLGGGLSGSSVFLVTDDSNKYVVKFFKNRKAGEREIYNSYIASDCGYGPKVYFSDSSKGELICEYLSGRKISIQDLQSNELYMELAHLLQKIHHGKKFQGTYDVFRRINHTLQNSREKCKTYIPIQKIEETTGAIRQALANHIYAVPCHNDLYGGNILFTESGCRAIDYGDAGQNDPYYDMATVVDYFQSEARDTLFLRTYLGRDPSSIEKAKLYLMKQVVLVKWMCDRLDNLTAEQMQQYDTILRLPKEEFLKVVFEGRLDLSKTEWAIQDLKVLLNEFLENSTSIEFSYAMTLLTEAKRDENRTDT